MKILYCQSNVDKNDGGTSAFIQLLANQVIKINSISVTIVALETSDPIVFDGKIIIHLFKNYLPSIFVFSRIIKKYFINVDVDIFHCNGLWGRVVHLMVYCAKMRKIPFVFSPHGMLEPWALNHKKLKKCVALKVFQRRDLESASCIHATAKSEAENIRKLGFTNPIAVIPNGIDIYKFKIKNKSINNEVKTILFLSRIHPKKGIELLIKAWSLVDNFNKSGWKIEIVGSGDKRYVRTLRKLIQEMRLEEEIKILGPLYGSAKLASYHRADLFVLPSFSENFGIVIAEALACGVPVIATKGTPWEELNSFGAGWWREIGLESLVDALNEALQLSDKDRKHMGENGRQLIENKYSIESSSRQMIELYNWLLGNVERPSFVYMK